jgi:hypothetical protein
MMTREPPADVEAAFSGFPPQSRNCARALRDLVLTTAEQDGIASVQEALRWGEPAYLPGRAGTTVRIGWDKATGDCKLLVNCQTSLVDDWRQRFGDRLTFEGNRAVRVPVDRPLDEVALCICIADAFTYHSRKKGPTLG